MEICSFGPFGLSGLYLFRKFFVYVFGSLSADLLMCQSWRFEFGAIQYLRGQDEGGGGRKCLFCPCSGYKNCPHKGNKWHGIFFINYFMLTFN